MTHVPLRELPEFVRNVRAVLKLLPNKKGATVVYLVGDLGAGKTTFVQTLAREYGIESPVQSPTYTLMRAYDIPSRDDRTAFGGKRRYKRIVHIDAYRLEKPQEFLALRPEQFLEEDGTLVLVEWPKKARGVLPRPDMTLTFSSEETGDSARDIEMRA